MGPNFAQKDRSRRRGISAHGRGSRRNACVAMAGLAPTASRNLVIARSGAGIRHGSHRRVGGGRRPLCPSFLRRERSSAVLHPDLLAVSRRRERRPSSRGGCSAPREGLLLNRIGTAVGPLSGSGDGSCRARWAVRPCRCPADHAWVLAGLRGRTRSAIRVKATRCPNTPMITASLDAMIRNQDEPQSVRN